MAKKINLSKREKYEQSFLYVADFLAESAKSDKNVIAMCAPSDLFKKICAVAHEREIDLQSLDFTGSDAENLPLPSEYESYISKTKTMHTLVLFNILPPHHYANSLKLARLTDGILLFEKYGKSKYSEFENCIDILKNSEVPILGIVGMK